MFEYMTYERVFVADVGADRTRREMCPIHTHGGPFHGGYGDIITCWDSIKGVRPRAVVNLGGKREPTQRLFNLLAGHVDDPGPNNFRE